MGNKNLSSTSNSKAIKAILVFYLFLLVISLKCAYSARILSDDDDDSSPSPVPQPSNPLPTPVVPNVAPVVGTTITTSATMAAYRPILSFFMHDILGGTAPSGRVVSGIIASSTSPQINGLPFSKKNGGVFPINGHINLPFIAGLNGASTTNNGNSLPFVSAGQLPQGATLQKLIFGAITVIDDELTLEQELGSSIIGKAQGFYLASSLDGGSQTMAFTALFGEHEEDTISFFGIHRTAAHESQVAVVGGSGKYENAQGHATIETLHLTDQHTTDGVETLLQISVYHTDY
ncbi:hypothetical protein Ddye_024936 [Dipteronia dyeriana]|uniref:Dirigent protein n=1 Tax=Dipteronia dyeriana TaxID=168575 RepID=A0AAD9WUM9_9ROSI|nr:hypothetical protein Ddye_024936 [Dipteronia dyeriana]